MLDILKQRRSIRKFTDQPLTPKAIQQILSAGLFAPTGRGVQSVELMPVNDRDTLMQLSQCKAHGTQPLKTATFGVAVLGNTTQTDVWVEDAALAAFAMQLQVHAMGLGSTWIQMRLRRAEDGKDSEEAVRGVLHLPAQYGVLCVIAIGYKDEEKPAHTDADLDWSLVRSK